MKPVLIFLFIAQAVFLGGCEREDDSQTATLTVTNNSNTPVWSAYVAATSSPTERSADLLASSSLEPMASQSFTIDTCGQDLDITVIFSNGSQQQVSSGAVIPCDTTYSCVVDLVGVMTCN